MCAHKTVFLVFRDSENPWVRLFKKGFRHMELLEQQDGRWFRLNPRSDRLDLMLIPNDPGENLARLKEYQGHRCFKITIDEKQDRGFYSLNPFNMVNCVSAMKYYIGLRKWVFTPYGLYKALIKMKSTNKFKHAIVDIHIIC